MALLFEEVKKAWHPPSSGVIDAMGTRTKIAERIIAQEGEYALALKDCQGTLYGEVKATFVLAEKDGFSASILVQNGRGF